MVLKSLTRRMLISEGGFEATLFMASPRCKGLVYLKA